MRKTKHQIIDEIASMYNLKNRAVENNTCKYLCKNGRKCAIGNMLINPSDFLGSVFMLVFNGELKQDDFKEEYKYHDTSFYIDCQRIHDLMENWSKSGLSVKGRDYVSYLKTKWSDD